MPRKPEWTGQEFEILISHPGTPAEDLISLLPRRTTEAIELIKSGIHSFHTEKNISMLSKVMLARLEDAGEDLVCPICGVKF